MKRLYILSGVVILLFTFISCSKDENDINDAIVGTWELTENGENWESYKSITFNSDDTGDFYYTEAENGEEIDKNNKEDLIQFTYSISGDKLFVTYNITEYEPYYTHHEVTEEYKYSISGNKLTLSYKDELAYDSSEVYTRKN